MTLEKKQAAVSACADAFADIEKAHEALAPLYDKAHALIGAAYDAGVGKHSEAVALRLGLEDAKGRNASALGKALKTHGLGTKIADREGCDVPPNLAIDGGLVQPLSGGR